MVWNVVMMYLVAIFGKGCVFSFMEVISIPVNSLNGKVNYAISLIASIIWICFVMHIFML